MARLVARDGSEAAIEAAIREALLAHGLQLKALSGERDGRLDDDVIQGHALYERVEVLGVTGQALSRRGQPLIKEDVVTLVRLGPDLGQQLSQALGAGAYDVVPPPLEENGVPRLVHHLGGKKDLDLWSGRRPYERGKGRSHPLLAVEEKAVGPEGRLPVQLV